MKQYIATFFSHFGAIRFQRLCVSKGWQAELRPVPRSLSSSCGTCVCFATAKQWDIINLKTPELESLVAVVQDRYVKLWEAKD